MWWLNWFTLESRWSLKCNGHSFNKYLLSPTLCQVSISVKKIATCPASLLAAEWDFPASPVIVRCQTIEFRPMDYRWKLTTQLLDIAHPKLAYMNFLSSLLHIPFRCSPGKRKHVWWMGKVHDEKELHFKISMWKIIHWTLHWILLWDKRKLLWHWSTDVLVVLYYTNNHTWSHSWAHNRD